MQVPPPIDGPIPAISQNEKPTEIKIPLLLAKIVDKIENFINYNPLLNNFESHNSIKELCSTIKHGAAYLLKKKNIIFISPDQRTPLIKKGDLVFGLSATRKEFLDRHLPGHEESFNQMQGTKVTAGKKKAVMVDTLNNQFLGTGYAYLSKDRKERSKMTKQEFNNAHTYQGKVRGEAKEVKKFRKFMEAHPKYDPRKIASFDESTLRIGRACKGALEYTIKNDRKIHFALDGLDVSKVFQDLKTDKLDRGITGKEIRWLYRHRNDENVQKNVIFYENGEVTQAPWHKNPEQWTKYDR